jgi:hypothetical protein
MLAASLPGPVRIKKTALRPFNESTIHLSSEPEITAAENLGRGGALTLTFGLRTML